MCDSNFANVNGSVPTAAAESADQPINNPGLKLYEVGITTEVQLSLSGYANVYAADANDAVDKVQAKIENEALDDDLQMEDFESGLTVTYGDVKGGYWVDFQIDGVEVIEHNVDPFDVLETEVEGLQASISWNTEALSKHKVFLESLLNEGDEEQAVAA